MRVYTNFIQAKNEIKRDLNELGTEVFAGYQSKVVDKEAFTTKELQNYDYRVLQPRRMDLKPSGEWVIAEWDERQKGIEGEAINPGEAWKLRKEIWEELLENNKKFSYTYAERFAFANVQGMLKQFQKNPAMRQFYIGIWDPIADSLSIGIHRVPCSLGYHFMIRNDHLDITYHMRSSDFSTHFDNDCYLALKLQEYIAEAMQVPPGTFTHVISSLHVYARDVAGTF